MFLLFAVLAAMMTLYLLGRAFQPMLTRELLTTEDFTRIEDESAELLSQRDRLVDELRDLESEAALNKISGEDLLRLRARFESEAVELVRKLDERAAAYADRLAPPVATDREEPR